MPGNNRIRRLPDLLPFFVPHPVCRRRWWLILENGDCCGGACVKRLGGWHNVRLSEAFGQFYKRIPLRKSPHIRVANALRLDWRTVLAPAECSYVLGPPPFVGKKEQNAEQKADMDIGWGEVKGAGVLDFVTCWYVKAARYITGGECPGSTGVSPVGEGVPPSRTFRRVADDCVPDEFPASNESSFRRDAETNRRDACATRTARVAFVSTNSISQGEQVSVLWGHLLSRYRVKIHFAHRTFPWESEARGKAHVHVIIIGFGLGDVPEKRLYDYDHDPLNPAVSVVRNISPYLIEGSDTVVTSRTRPVCGVPEIAFGSMPNDGGHLLLSPEDKTALIASEPGTAKFIRLILGLEEFLNGKQRFCLWLSDAPPNELRVLPTVMQRVERMRESRAKSSRATTRELAKTPSVFGEIRQPKTRYLAMPPALAAAHTALDKAVDKCYRSEAFPTARPRPRRRG